VRVRVVPTRDTMRGGVCMRARAYMRGGGWWWLRMSCAEGFQAGKRARGPCSTDLQTAKHRDGSLA